MHAITTATTIPIPTTTITAFVVTTAKTEVIKVKIQAVFCETHVNVILEKIEILALCMVNFSCSSHWCHLFWSKLNGLEVQFL